MRIRIRLPVDAPALWEAVYIGDIHRVKSLLSTGVDPQEKASTNNCTALHVAALHGKLEIVYELILAAQMGCRDYTGLSVCNVQDGKGLMPLHYACSRLMINVCKMLITFGAATSTEHCQYSQPVLIAARAGTQRLEDEVYGYGPCVGIYGDGLFRQMRLQVVELLLEKGADVSNCKWCQCRMMIWELAIESYTDTALLKLLLNAVAVTGKSIPVHRNGDTIMHYVAGLNGHLSENGADIKMLEMLRLHARKTHNNRLDISTENRDGNTTLYFACKFGKIDTVKYLLDQGVDPPIENSLDDLSRVTSQDVWDILVAEFNRREERNIAFAMASHQRLGTMSLPRSLPPEVMRVISEQGGRALTWPRIHHEAY